mmetsp:Transcript_21647/g.24664  ORF Transcript_21647/g.24664 Transcript_21647/m.24664 type:complete len:100 (+) Transcript_21647:103-402(+)
MTMLFPPLEDSRSSCIDGNDDVLSPQLKENFNKIRAIMKQEKISKRRTTPSMVDDCKDLQTKKQKIALETALAVEDEMSRLRNGIAELEALLAQHENVI